jgi:hypothetical protein
VGAAHLKNRPLARVRGGKAGTAEAKSRSKKTYFLNKAKGAFTRKKTAQYWQ